MLKKFLLALFLLTGLIGCATGPQHRPIQERIKIPDALPDKLGGDGLLVATIAAGSVARSGVERLTFSLADIQIDNTLYGNAIRKNYLVLPLKPGDYTVDSLHVLRSLEDRTQTRYPMNMSFRIVAGQATNLGVITLVKDTRPQASETSFLKIRVDNTDDMTAYLRKHHPKLAVSLSPQRPVLAAGYNYPDAAKLEILRRDIARRTWLLSDNVNTATYVGGEVGTVAKLLRNTRGKLAAIDVLDTKTTVAMHSCSGHDNRFVCSSAEPALYHLNGTTLTRRELPMPATHVWVHTFPPQGLVLVDQNQTVYMSSDNGTTWKKQVWYDRKKPLDPLANIKFSNGKNGYYVYTTWTFDPLVAEVMYSDYSHKGLQRVDIPKMKDWGRLLELSQGLVVGIHNANNKTDPARLYFRAHGQTEWRVRTLPGNRCQGLQHENNLDETLMVFCDSKLHVSKDAGTSWALHESEKK